MPVLSSSLSRRGRPGTLSTLKSLGFQTFGSVVNESYDGVLDAASRVEAALQEAKRLSELGREQQAQLWLQVESSLVHNQRHLMCGGLTRVLTAYAREVLEHGMTAATKTAAHRHVHHTHISSHTHVAASPSGTASAAA